MHSDPWAKYRVIVEARIREQLERHFSINPNTDPKRIVKLQIQQEKQRLELRLGKLQESDEDEEIKELALRYVIDDWLPSLERRLLCR